METNSSVHIDKSVFQSVSEGLKQQLFIERRNYCMNVATMVNIQDIQSTLDCMTACVTNLQPCVALAYVPSYRQCFMSSELGHDCTVEHKHYRGK